MTKRKHGGLRQGAGRKPSEKTELRLRLSHEAMRTLRTEAKDAGVTPPQLAAVWIEEALLEPEGAAAEADGGEVPDEVQIPVFEQERLDDHLTGHVPAKDMVFYEPKVGGIVSIRREFRGNKELYTVTFNPSGPNQTSSSLVFDDPTKADAILRCAVLSPTREQARLSGLI